MPESFKTEQQESALQFNLKQAAAAPFSLPAAPLPASSSDTLRLPGCTPTRSPTDCQAHQHPQVRGSPPAQCSCVRTTFFCVLLPALGVAFLPVEVLPVPAFLPVLVRLVAAGVVPLGVGCSFCARGFLVGAGLAAATVGLPSCRAAAGQPPSWSASGRQTKGRQIPYGNVGESWWDHVRGHRSFRDLCLRRLGRFGP